MVTRLQFDESEIVILPTASLRPHPENKKIYLPRDNEDLKASIAEHGVMEPLVVKPDRKTVLGGARRLESALDLGVKTVQCIIRDYDDDVIALIELNRYRHKSPGEVHAEVTRLRPYWEAKAQERQKAAGAASKGVKKGEPLPPILGEPVDVEEEVARSVGMSHGTLNMLETVMGSGKKDLIDKVNSGALTISAAYKEHMEPGYEKPEFSLGPYFAGKTQMTHNLAAILDSIPHKCYVEVFGGMANVLLNKPPSEVEVYNEISPDVVNILLSLKEYPREFLAELYMIPFSRFMYERLIEEIVNEKAEPTDYARAARWWAANFMTYLTIHHKPTIGNWQHSPVWNIARSKQNHFAGLLAVVPRLQEVQIANMDWEKCFEYYDGDGTLFYLDPPYYGTDQALGFDFTPEQHIHMSEVLKAARGRWVLTYNDCPEIRAMYKGHLIESQVIRKNTTTRANETIDHFPNIIIYDLTTSKERLKSLKSSAA